MSISKRSVNRIFFLLVVLVALVVITVVPACAAEATVDYNGPRYAYNKGSKATVWISIESDESIGEYDFSLSYDTKKLRYTGGAESESKGIIKCQGVGASNEVSYVLKFDVLKDCTPNLELVSCRALTTGNTPKYFDVVPGLDISQKYRGIDDIYGLNINVPILGTTYEDDGTTLYVVDLSRIELDRGIWDYNTKIDSLFGKDYTFATDARGTVLVVPMVDDESNYYLYAYDKSENKFYKVEEITIDGKNAYAISLNACNSIPPRMAAEGFYAIFDGVTAFYYENTDGNITKYNAVKSFGNTYTILIACSIAGLILLSVVLVFIKNLPRLKERYVLANKQYIFVIDQLTSREIKRKYARSKLGIVWSVLNPLLLMVVMSVIFSYMFRRSIDNFPLYYLTGSIIWTLFSDGSTHAMTSLVDNKTLLLKAKLPKGTFVLSRIYTALVNFGYTCIAYVLMLIVFKAELSWTMLLFPLDIALVLIMTTGISYILSILYVFFADIKHLYTVLLRVLLYLSAIFYPVSSLPTWLQGVIGFNPVYMAIYIARESVVYGRMPDYTAWLKLAIAALVTLLLGLRVFRKNENKVMQVI